MSNAGDGTEELGDPRPLISGNQSVSISRWFQLQFQNNDNPYMIISMEMAPTIVNNQVR